MLAAVVSLCIIYITFAPWLIEFLCVCSKGVLFTLHCALENLKQNIKVTSNSITTIKISSQEGETT